MHAATDIRRTRSPIARLAAALSLSVLLSAAACGDTDDEPKLTIRSPAPGSTHQLGADQDLRLTISANDFELKAPGACGDDTNCGQAWLNIDGAACNRPGLQYNNLLGDGTLGQDFFIDADFSFCPPGTVMGNHILTVSLRRPDGTAVIGEGGAPVQATLNVIITNANADGGADAGS